MVKTNNDHVEYIIYEMCRRVGGDYGFIKTIMYDRSINWYNAYYWTEEDSEKFLEWLKGYLVRHEVINENFVDSEVRAWILMTWTHNKARVKEFWEKR